jgi:tetratricopeptide (TPR) repeat protein
MAASEVEALVQQGISASKAGDKRRARQLLQQAVQLDPKNESAWLWLSDTLADVGFRRLCLEKVLALNPNNAAARKGLEALRACPPVEAAPSEAPTPLDTPPQPSAGTRLRAATQPSLPIPPEAPPWSSARTQPRLPLPPEEAPSPLSSSPTPSPGSNHRDQILHPAGSRSEYYCPWCNAPVYSGLALTCPECQRQLEFDCPRCAESVPLEKTACPRCGHDLGDFRQKQAYLARLGEAYYAKGWADRALPVYQYLLEMEPRRVAHHVRLSQIYDQLEKTDEAAAEAERAAALDPLNVEALDRLGHWYLKRGQHQRAAELAARLTALKDRSPRLTLLLGDLEYERMQYPAALRAYTRVRESKTFHEFDPAIRANLLFRLGELYRLGDDLQMALKAYQACVETGADLYEVGEARRWVERIRPPLPAHALRSHGETARAMAGPLLAVWLTGAVALGCRLQALTLLAGLGLFLALIGSYLLASALSTPLAAEWRALLGQGGLSAPFTRRIAALGGGGLLIVSFLLVLFGM